MSCTLPQSGCSDFTHHFQVQVFMIRYYIRYITFSSQASQSSGSPSSTGNTPKMYFLQIQNYTGLVCVMTFFNPWVFWRWFFYAVWQGALLLFCSYITLNTENHDGDPGSLLISGQFVFGAIVFIVNIKVLISSYLFNFWQVLWIFLSIFSFFIIFYLLNKIVVYQMYGVFWETMTFPATYTTFFFFMFAYILVETGL